MKLSNSKNSQLPLLVALVAALLFALFYYVVLPKKDEAKALESSVSTLKSEIVALEGQKSDQIDDNIEVANIFELRKKVPQSREIDQLLLNIEELEFVTDSRIQAITFNNYDSVVSESELVPTPEEEVTEEAATPEETTTEEEPAREGETITETGETTEQADSPISTIAAETLPAELKMITFVLDVSSSNYENLQQFIKEIENLERVMHIDTINYSLPGEENEFAEEPTDEVTASIQITTFYYEGEK